MKKRVLVSVYKLLQKIVNSFGWQFELLKLSRKGPIWRDIFVPKAGLLMHLDLSESLDGSYAVNLIDDNCVQFLRDQMVINDGVFVDLGANQGMYSLIVLNETESKVISIEPDPYSLNKLRKNLELNGLSENNLTICEVAAGVSDGEEVELMLNLAGNRAGSSLVVDPGQVNKNKNNENRILKIKTMTLNSILKKSGVTQVSVLKADIEGYEYPVLAKFFGETDESIWPKAVIIEAHGFTIPLVGGSSLNLLFSNGYKLITHDSLNYMFVRNTSKGLLKV